MKARSVKARSVKARSVKARTVKARTWALALLVLTGISSSAAAAAAPQWRELGPAPIHRFGYTGRVAALALSRSNADTYFAAGASGGVWRSRDGGQSWSARTDRLPTTAMGAIAPDPRNEKIVYAGSGEAHNRSICLYGAGLYKSTDGGQTFRALAGKTFEGLAFSRLVVSPNGELWAAVSRAGGTAEGFEGARQHPRRNAPMGLFASTDGGNRWRLVRNGLPELPASDVALDPRDPNRIFVAASDIFGDGANGIYLSTDGGRSFREVLGVDGSTMGRIAIAIAPSDPDYVYAIASRPRSREPWGGSLTAGNETLALFASRDGGLTWTSTNPGNFLGNQGDYDMAIAVAPHDPQIVVLGGVEALRSTDGGATLQNITPPHVDIHDLDFDAAGRLIAAGDGGVFRSDDLGRSWNILNGGLGTVQYYAGLAVSAGDPEFIAAGSQDNGTHVRRGDGSWEEVAGGDGGWVAAHPDDPNRYVVQFQGTGNVFLTVDGGLTFIPLRLGIDPNDRTAFHAPLLWDPDTDALFYATQRLYVSDGSSPGFRPVSDDLTSGPPWAIRSLALSASDPGTLYATTNDGRVLVSSDRGTTWTHVLDGITGWPLIMRQVAIDPADANVAAVVDGGFGGARVLLTRDHGATWTEIGHRLPDLPIFAVAIHHSAGRREIFVGTDRGVYATANDGTSWVPYGVGLPNAPVHDVVVDATHGRVVVATFGRGMWTSPLVAIRGGG